MRPVRALVVPLLVLLAWQLAASLGLASPYLLPAPATVLHTAGDMLESGLLVRHTAASLGRVARGFSISVAAGCALAALLTALLTKALGRKFWSLCVAMVVGCAACYVLGTIWFMILTGADLVSALGWCVLPYLPGDAVKIVLAAVLTMQLDKRLKGSLV